jgi:hypothetical protein
MADYLPEMIEPPTPVPTIENAEENVHVPDNISDVIREVDSEELGSEVDDSELIEQEDNEGPEPSLIEKQKLNMDDIFGAPKVKKIKLNREELAEERKRVREAIKLQKAEEKERLKQEKILQKEKEKAEARAGRPKKQLSPEHLKKLQEARAKAQAQKKANKSISESLPPNKVKIPKSESSSSEAMFTKEDLIKSQYEAIQMYDSKRKKEKAEKKKKEKEEQMLAQSQQTIRRAIGQPDPNDIWSHALNGMFQ